MCKRCQTNSNFNTFFYGYDYTFTEIDIPFLGYRCIFYVLLPTTVSIFLLGKVTEKRRKKVNMVCLEVLGGLELFFDVLGGLELFFSLWAKKN